MTDPRIPGAKLEISVGDDGQVMKWPDAAFVSLWRDIWSGPGSPARRKQHRLQHRARKARRGWR